jgi:hypothetical protein
MTARPLAAWLIFWTIWFHALAIGAAITIGHRPAAVGPMNCPAIVVTHGVGSDLKTWAKARDLCAEGGR